jgi:hypothetical protein
MGRKPHLSFRGRLTLPALILAGTLATGLGCGSSRHNRPATLASDASSPVALASAGSSAMADALSAVSADAYLDDPFASSVLEAVIVPPAGWTPDPAKRSRNHAHQAWISPSGRTAYGVIRINLPLPFIGPDLVLPRFIEEMRNTEGEATLLSQRDDPRLRGIRFVVEGGQYRLRASLVTRGFRAWAVYAGTLRGEPEIPEELAVAESAREQTRIGTTRVRAKSR